MWEEMAPQTMAYGGHADAHDGMAFIVPKDFVLDMQSARLVIGHYSYVGNLSRELMIITFPRTKFTDWPDLDLNVPTLLKLGFDWLVTCSKRLWHVPLYSSLLLIFANPAPRPQSPAFWSTCSNNALCISSGAARQMRNEVGDSVRQSDGLFWVFLVFPCASNCWI